MDYTEMFRFRQSRTCNSINSKEHRTEIYHSSTASIRHNTNALTLSATPTPSINPRTLLQAAAKTHLNETVANTSSDIVQHQTDFNFVNSPVVTATCTFHRNSHSYSKNASLTSTNSKLLSSLPTRLSSNATSSFVSLLLNNTICIKCKITQKYKNYNQLRKEQEMMPLSSNRFCHTSKSTVLESTTPTTTFTTNINVKSHDFLLHRLQKFLYTVIFLIFIFRFGIADANQVILLDTTREATLKWTHHPYGPEAQSPGWVEESVTDFVKGSNWSSYVVCDVAYRNVNNWLLSPFIERGPAKRLYIEIQFTIRDCSLFPGSALSCKETFSLLYYEHDAATREPPPWQPDSYKLIARMAAWDGRFNQNSDEDINTDVRSIAVTKKGVYFAFRDQGACMSVLAVKVYFITCPSVTENFAHFNETPTGREITIIEKQNGICVDNAEPYEPPMYLCKGNGKWAILTGGCHCKIGYEPDFINKTCNECPAGTFRSMEIIKCTSCPSNTKSSRVGVGFCACLPGFYRHPRDDKHMPCYKPPGPPTNLTLLFVDQTSAILSWNSPAKESDGLFTKVPNPLKYRNDVVYKLRCQSCSSNVVFNPATDTFNDTKLTLTNLKPVTTYNIQIHSMNGFIIPEMYPNEMDATAWSNDNSASNIGDINAVGRSGVSSTSLAFQQPVDLNRIKTEYAEIMFTTESAILSAVFNVRVVAITNKEVDLVWDNPIHTDSSPIEFYEVRWFLKPESDAINTSALNTKETKARIEGLHENAEYGFQVRCKTVNGYGAYSNIVYAQTSQNVSPVYDDTMQMAIVAGASVAVVFIFMLVIVAVTATVKSTVKK